MKCYECKQCNHKGKSSVLKYSRYCNNHRINKVLKFTLISRFKKKLYSLMYEDGIKKHIKGFR